MSNEGKPEKSTSFVQRIRQKLIDDLIAVSDKSKVGEDGANSEKLQEERLAVLNKYGQQTESAEQVLGKLATEMKALHGFAEGGPYKLNDLLVSKDSWPFEDLSQVDAHFGPLPNGYCYRNLVSESYSASKVEANNANNLIRLPSAFSSLVNADLRLAGDGIPNGTLFDWLRNQPGALNRLWNLRALAERGVLQRSELPMVAMQEGGGPWGKAVARGEPVGAPQMTPEIKQWLDDFVSFCSMHYNGQERENDVDTIGGVFDKKDAFKRLKEIPNGPGALRLMIDHRQISVRVSASIYLLLSDPQLALPVLQQVAATKASDGKNKHSRCARVNAQRALWMYRDGMLSHDA